MKSDWPNYLEGKYKTLHTKFNRIPLEVSYANYAVHQKFCFLSVYPTCISRCILSLLTSIHFL